MFFGYISLVFSVEEKMRTHHFIGSAHIYAWNKQMYLKITFYHLEDFLSCLDEKNLSCHADFYLVRMRKKLWWKQKSSWRDNIFRMRYLVLMRYKVVTSNRSWCMGIKGEMSGTVCVTFTWDMYIYIWVVSSLCFFCCLFIIVTWWYVWCIEWASGNEEEVQACLVTLWLFIISCYSLYKTTLGLLCSWFENNPHFHKYSMNFHV